MTDELGGPSKPFILGVNYWPRRKAMYWWSEFEVAEVQEEFEIIKDTGLSLVRIFLFWEDWQPSPDRVSKSALNCLGKVCEIAADLGLQLDVTFFTGHMSGPSWVPAWMLRKGTSLPAGVHRVVSGRKSVGYGYINPFTDDVALQASELLVRTVVSHFKDHPAIGLWNIGNEPDLFAWPPDAASGRAWAKQMTALIHETDPTHPVTCGLHINSLIENNGLRVHEIFSEVDIPAMHGYPMYADWSNGPLDIDFVPFLCALTSALCGKSTLMEEFGGCTVAPGKPSSVWEWTSYGKHRKQFMASEEELAAYVGQVLPKLVEVGAVGAVLWCYADYIPELYQCPPCDEAWHERFFGLVRPDGTLKPHARVLKDFAATNPCVQPAQRKVTLEIPAHVYYKDPLANAKRLYRAFST